MSQSVRTGLTSEEIKQDFRDNLRCGALSPNKTADVSSDDRNEYLAGLSVTARCDVKRC